MKITEKLGVLSILGILLVFIIVISSSYAYFRPTIQGNDTAKTITLSSKKIPPHPLYGVLEDLANEGTYAATYTGNSNDTYGVAGTKTIYYIKTKTSNSTSQASTLLNKINVKFAGMCWQILRTTDTGGVKLIYNGEYVEGPGCYPQTDTEHQHNGIIGTQGSAGKITGNYMYADSFTYDDTVTPGTFTLVNPVVDNWANNKNLVGKYTCQGDNTTSTCETLFYINAKHRTNNNNAWYTTYTIGLTQNSQIGISPFSANYMSTAYIGYKFGDTIYEYVNRTAPSTGVIMGKDVYWNGSNYVLKDGNSDSNHQYSTPENDYHYTCNTTSATCTDGKVRYYYYYNSSKGYYFYTELVNGDTVETAISKMVGINNANTRDSAIKSYLDNWYRKKILNYASYLEENAVYCNDRSINDLGGWSKIGENTSILFKNDASLLDFGCANDKDKFSVGNSNAELDYPIGLPTKPEMYGINNNTVRLTGQLYLTLSPNYYAAANAYINCIRDDNGSFSTSSVHNVFGIRPVITLKPSRDTVTGTGTLSDPYVIGSNN